MKRRIYSAVAIASLLASCETAPKYTLNGTVEGIEQGNLYIIETVNGVNDTLVATPINAGKFSAEGVVDSVHTAFIAIQNERGQTPIILENADYQIKINPKKYSENSVTGPERQNILFSYIELTNKFREHNSALYKEFQEAMNADDQDKMAEIRTKASDLAKKHGMTQDSLMQAHSGAMGTAFAIANNISSYSLEQLKEAYAKFDNEAKSCMYGKMIDSRIKVLASVAVGQKAPNFTLNTPEGKPLSLYDVKGKVKIIDFWASWCGPCRKANPHMVALYKQYHKKGLEILGVSLDNNKTKWEDAIEADKLTWPQVSDLKGWGSMAAKLYGVSGIPAIIVLDENNVIIAKNLRGEALDKKLEELFK